MGSGFDEYLARAPERHQQALKQLRDTVRSAVPDADEVIRTGVPAFRYRGKPLVSIGPARRHVSLFVMYGGALKAHASELEAYDTSNTVVRFDPEQPIPVRLVERLVRARAAEIDDATEGDRASRRHPASSTAEWRSVRSDRSRMLTSAMPPMTRARPRSSRVSTGSRRTSAPSTSPKAGMR